MPGMSITPYVSVIAIELDIQDFKLDHSFQIHHSPLLYEDYGRFNDAYGQSGLTLRKHVGHP